MEQKSLAAYPALTLVLLTDVCLSSRGSASSRARASEQLAPAPGENPAWHELVLVSPLPRR